MSNLLLEGKETGPVGEAVVVATGVGVAALVQQLQVARVDSHGLVVGDLDKVTVGDVVGPGGTAVSLAGEGVGLSGGIGGPVAVEAGGSERAEVTAVSTLGLDDHEVTATLDSVDLDGLEEVLGGVAHDDGGGSAEVAREVGLGHAGAVDLAVVTSEEEVHVLAVTNDSLVNSTSAAARDLASEERLSGTPAVGVGGVAGGPVGEGGRSPLVGKNPDVLGSEAEEGRSNSSEAHGVLRGRGHLAKVAEGTEVHGSILGASVVVGSVDNVLAVKAGDGEVLERSPARLGLSKNTPVSPLVGGRELAVLGRRSRSQERERSRGEAKVGRNETHFCWS